MAIQPLGLASSLLSVAWSRDNLVTAHPARLYDGKIHQLVTQRSLPAVVQHLEQRFGTLSVRGARLGLHGWKLDFQSGAHAYQLHFPIAVDDPGSRGRCRRLLPQHNFEHQRSFVRQGLDRFALVPKQLHQLGNTLPAALVEAPDGFSELLFARGGLCARQEDPAGAQQSWQIQLDLPQAAELMAEMVAALSYYYDPQSGRAVADVCFNDGDFLARRRPDGSFELKLAQLRTLEAGISSQRLLLYLVQLVAYEFWHLLDAPIGIPVVASNPSVAFEGLVRGRRYRALDLGLSAAAGEAEAHEWLIDLSRSPAGRSYRPWVERFIAGELPLQFGRDLRERWWRLGPLQQQRHLLELRYRQTPTDRAALAAAERLLEQLREQVGAVSAQPPLTLNGWSAERWLAQTRRASVPPQEQQRLLGEVFANWPYRSQEQFEQRIPQAKLYPLLELPHGKDPSPARATTLLGPAVPEQEARTTQAFSSVHPPLLERPVANADWYDAIFLPTALHEAAARELLSFEQYMDDALHDPEWGYYAHAVSIGRRGHFVTHPEALTPHYGRWVARWAFTSWCSLCNTGSIHPEAPFAMIEFGAGNGRLARDFIDALKAPAPADLNAERWAAFSRCVRYRIYERSRALRERQQQLLGDEAQIRPGDARTAEQRLAQDYPAKIHGVILSNELPDAFGCHKVLLSSSGESLAALVLPRVEAALQAALSPSLANAIEAADRRLRQRFGLGRSPRASLENPAPGRGTAAAIADERRYIDPSTYALLMRELAQHPAEARRAHLHSIWFQEAYVSTACFPRLAEHLKHNAEQYAIALAAADSGVLIYINLHANAWMRGVASALRSGFVLTIDYGDSTWGLIQGARRGDFRLRVYGDHADEWLPRPNDPYALPGTQDMTADINFTDLAEVAKRCGHHVVHYGLESDLIGPELPELLPHAERAPFDDLIGNPAFKLLITATQRATPIVPSLTIPQTLTCDLNRLSPEQRNAAGAIQARLEGR